MTFLGEQQWFLFALIFFGAIGYIALIRWRDRVWIDRQYGLHTAKMMSFGVSYFGLASDPGRRRHSSGFLILLPDRLVFRSRFKQVNIEVIGDQITGISHGNSHGGVKLHQPVIKIAFQTSENKRDAVAFKVPYPAQWMTAIKTGFIDSKSNQASTRQHQ